MNVAPGASFEATTDAFAAGLAGTLGVRISDGAGGTFLARTTAGVAEDVTVGAAAVYRRTFTAPTTAGQYWLVWDDAASVSREELVVTSSAATAAVPAGSDLCALADVYRYAPGFDASDPGNAETLDTLTNLIAAQSVDILERTGREFAGIAGLNPRSFDIGAGHLSSRTLAIGDAAAVTSVEQWRNGSLDGEITDDVILEPRNRQPWQPLTRLRFPSFTGSPVLLQVEDVIVVDATWGYPSVPADVREACAKLVVVRYLTDVAAAGTAFSDAISEDVSVGGLLASGNGVVKRYSIP